MVNLRVIAGSTAVLLAVCLPVPSMAVTDEEIFRDFRFNFINPGARSLGMGGSFIAVADDATAAQANPAGLTNFSDPQLFAEARYSRVDRTATERTFGLQDVVDFNVSSGTEPGNRSTPSFLSYVYARNNYRFGFSRQEVLSIRNTTDSRTRIIADDTTDERRGRGEIDLLLVHWNASVAVQLKTLSLGATLSYGRMELQSSLVNTYELKDSPDSSVLLGVPIELFSTESDGTADDVTATVGLLWAPSDRWAIGTVWRQGGDYSIDQRLTAQSLPPGPTTLVPRNISSRVFFNESGKELTADEQGERFDFANEFHVPETVGLGVAWRSADGLTFSADVVRVAWSDLLEGFNSRLNVLTIGWETEAEAAFTVDDQTNVHAGIEYDWKRGEGVATWSFRAGYHTNKDNRIRANFPNGDFGFGLGSNENFPRGTDEDHFALGVGVVFDRFQLDFAGDASEKTTEVVASLIFSFGGE